MYDCAETVGSGLTRPANVAGFRLNWWVLGLAGMAALALAVCMGPAPAATPPSHALPAALPPALPVAPRSATVGSTGPTEIPLLDPLAKASVGLLIVYAAGWGLVRIRGRRAAHGGWLTGLSLGRASESLPRLRISETLSLGRQQGALHLVEVEDTTLLVGVVMDQMQVLWSSAADADARLEAAETLPPVATQPVLVPSSVAPRPAPSQAAATVRRGIERPVRAEADWALQRGRLISALMKGDPAAGGGERS